MSNWFYFDFINPRQAIDRALLKKDYNINFRYIYKIIGTRISMFYYKSLPDNLTSTILETALFITNRLCFYNSKYYGLGLYQYSSVDSDLNRYNKPDKVKLLALNGTELNEIVDYKDIVLVKDNAIDLPPILNVWEYLDIIDEIEATLKAQLNQLSLPMLFKGSKKQVNTFKQLASKSYTKEPFAFVDDSINGSSMEKYDIKLSISPIDIYELKTKYLNELLGSLGIYSIDEKKERFLQTEVISKNDYVDFVYNNFYTERKRFVKECNEKFGTNIELKESFEENRKDDIKEQELEAKAIAKGTALGENYSKKEDKKDV